MKASGAALLAAALLAAALLALCTALDPVKDGCCPQPPSYPTCATFPTKQVDECATDQQCPNNEKCCDYGCSLKCKKPLQDKLGTCPYFNSSICITARPAPAECSMDSQCQGTERCCCGGACRMQCEETEKSQPCPPPDQQWLCVFPVNKLKCELNGNCPEREICCSSCGGYCMKPPEHKGKCPVELGKQYQCGSLPPSGCKDDCDCKSSEKCCLFEDKVQCVAAVGVNDGHQ